MILMLNNIVNVNPTGQQPQHVSIEKSLCHCACVQLPKTSYSHLKIQKPLMNKKAFELDWIVVKTHK